MVKEARPVLKETGRVRKRARLVPKEAHLELKGAAFKGDFGPDTCPTRARAGCAFFIIAAGGWIPPRR